MLAEVQRTDSGSSGDGEKWMDWTQKLEGDLVGLAGGRCGTRRRAESLVTRVLWREHQRLCCETLSVRCL